MCLKPKFMMSIKEEIGMTRTKRIFIWKLHQIEEANCRQKPCCCGCCCCCYYYCCCAPFVVFCFEFGSFIIVPLLCTFKSKSGGEAIGIGGGVEKSGEKSRDKLKKKNKEKERRKNNRLLITMMKNFNDEFTIFFSYFICFFFLGNSCFFLGCLFLWG